MSDSMPSSAGGVVRQASLRLNVIANVMGLGVTAIVGLAVVPFYQRLVGVEAYGLISFYVTLNALFVVLDFGLSTAANREVGVVEVTGGAGTSASLLRTLELLYVLVALVVFSLVWAASPFLAGSWLRTEDLAPSLVQTCIVMGGATIGLRWPISLYAGVIRGLERQVLLNLVAGALATGRAAGSVLWLVFAERSAVGFFRFQMIYGAAETLAMAAVAWAAVGRGQWRTARPDGRHLRRALQFGSSVAGLTLFAMLIKQADKLVVSRLLPIFWLGVYNSAVVAAGGITLVAQPIQTAVFPRFTRLFAAGHDEELARTFHRSSGLMTFATALAAAIGAFWAEDLLAVWLQDAEIASHASTSLRWLALAAVFNGPMGTVFVLQLAANKAWLPLVNNAIGFVVMGPTTYVLVSRYGISGAGASWLIYNVLYYSILPHVLFRFVLSRERRRWYVRDTAPFMITSVGILWLAHALVADVPSVWLRLAATVPAALVYVVVSALWSPDVRSILAGLSEVAARPFSRRHATS